MLARFSNRVMFFRKVSLTRPGGAVAVLGDDQLGDAGLVVGVVVLGAVEEEDDVGVLLDGARLAEVGHPGAAVLAVLDGPVELREGDDRDVQLAGERLEPPADLGDLLLAAVARLLAVDELDVVDHDQAEVLPELEPAGVGGDLEHVPRGGVVDEQRRRAAARRSALPSWVISRLPRPWPVRSLWPSTRDREQSSRSASSSWPISRLTNRTGILQVDGGVVADVQREAPSCPCSAGPPG